ncbi:MULTISPECIES: energy-coupling factor ABC transporter permease [Caloramator]|uniref:Cobalt transport protein CbiM n=1 Tax=Caloramator proteoclasticus DSM 10124 TaxID=1121262 RepID=A0A1M4S8B5_9CLOT|nr:MULTISPECIES: energy-coupling factor ABC transporter permease [Caloramator]SHE28415.1 cobalt/nickel transport system permease protein [Caloramator proteoclasticus DSM 10124]
MKNKKLFLFLILFLLPKIVYAMHIGEGLLPPFWAALYYVLMFPFVIKGAIEIKGAKEKEIKMLIALSGAFIFLLSALKLPSVTGSCSHPTGTGLAAILFGPFVTAFLSMIVLIFQALLLAHGGITTLGANTFSMGVVGPFIAFFTYKLLKNKNRNLAVFLAAFLGDFTTYIITSVQLALAFNKAGFLSSFIKFISIFAVTQIPLAVMEGILTVVIYEYITKNASEELKILEVK